MQYYPNVVRANKAFIQNLFYTLNTFRCLHSTILAGPSVSRLYNMCANFTRHIVFSYEINKDTLLEQLMFKPKQDLPLFQPYGYDVSKAKPTGFMDIDLMKSFATDGIVINQLLTNQLAYDKLATETKVFIGTVSMIARQHNKQDVFNWLEKTVSQIDDVVIFDKRLEEEDHCNSQGSCTWRVRYNTQFKGRIQRFDVFTYNDKQGPMLTFRVIYR